MKFGHGIWKRGCSIRARNGAVHTGHKSIVIEDFIKLEGLWAIRTDKTG